MAQSNTPEQIDFFRLLANGDIEQPSSLKDSSPIMWRASGRVTQSGDGRQIAVLPDAPATK